MDNEESLSAETVVVGETVLIGALLAGSYAAEFPPSVRMEVLFPAHILYCLLTYMQRRPEAAVGRRLLLTWLLIFSDWVILGKTHEVWPWPHIIFLGLFIALDILPSSTPSNQLSNHVLRGLLYQFEALYKAITLVDTVNSAYQLWYETGDGLAYTLLVGVIRLITPAVVYTLDQVIWMQRDQSAYLGPYLRTAPIATAGLMYFLHCVARDEKSLTMVQMVVCGLMLLWYGYEAIRFSRTENKSS